MLTVSTLKNFDFFYDFSLIAGETGLYRNVTNVVILDFEGVEGNYYGFQPGDFVITNLLFAKDNPERIYPSFQALMDMEVSAFAVKTVIFSELPQEVIRLANEKGIPIFTFQDIFIEDVIINITDYLRSSANYNYYEGLVEQLVCKPFDNTEIHRFIHALELQIPADLCSTAFLSPKGHVNEFALQKLINKTQLALHSLHERQCVFVVKYKKGMLLFAFFEDKKNAPSHLKSYWRSLLRSVSVDSSRYHIGINDSLLPTAFLDVAIRRCLHACRDVSEKPCDYGFYSALGISNIVFPLLEDRYAASYLLELIQKAAPECDSMEDFSKSPLFPTLRSYVEHHFDIVSTADALFTHQNTVRYRMKKLKESMEIADEAFFKIILSAIYYSCI